MAEETANGRLNGLGLGSMWREYLAITSVRVILTRLAPVLTLVLGRYHSKQITNHSGNVVLHFKKFSRDTKSVRAVSIYQ